MDRFASVSALAFGLLACAIAVSCSTGTTANVVPNPVPASVSLTPAANVSLELGKILPFTAAATNSVGTAVTETFTYQSSTPGVVTVANNGQVCAGTWNSLSAPVVCTPGSTGIAQVTATANGVTSPPTTVYVHQHVTNVVIQKAPGQAPTLSSTCLSEGAPSGPERVLYEAFAYAGAADITSSVGPFTWGVVGTPGQPSTSVPLSFVSTGVNAVLNQRIAVANAPGTTSLFASAGGLNSQPVPFTTCPVASVSLSVNGVPVGTTPFFLDVRSTLSIDATVKDSIGMTLTAVPLTWSSSYPGSVGVVGGGSTAYASVGDVTASVAGAATVTASCAPPACNGGFTPSLSIYPAQAASVIVKTSATTTTTTVPTIYVTSTGCSANAQACITRIVPITRSNNTAPFAAGTAVNLPFTPNSLVFGPTTSSLAYLGVQDQAFGTQGLMTFDGTTVSQFDGTAGRVLAVSPDGATAILSDTTDSPTRVIICKSCNTALPTLLPILFPAATAAAFSPEGAIGTLSGYKAYVVSGGSCPGTSSAGCLLVYSTVDAPKTVSLTAPATDTAFIGEGAFGFIAGGDPAGMTYLGTCSVPPSTSGALPTVNASNQLLRQMPDGYSVLGLSPPNIQLITANLSGSGCPAPRGSLNITNTVGPTINLGVGAFAPTQFLISPDGQIAYILGQTTGAVPLPFIITFNFTLDAPSLISLTGGATPLSASLSPAGDLLFVGADDDSVHVIDAATGFDTEQVALTFPQSSLCVGPGTPASQVVLSSATVSAAAQNGFNTTYTYSLTASSTPLSVGETIVVSGMGDSGNNGTFTISALGVGTFTVSNASGTTAVGQSGTAKVPLPCNPDLIATKP
jgi:trimeric autotransporter adhesin